jgi:glycosyltransferase involved in cell wall biosynthesis
MSVIKIKEFRNPIWGKAFTRISNAFHDYAPDWVQWVDNEDEADILLVHVIGTGEVEWLKKPKPKIIVQHCYFTAGDVPYVEYWKKALLTLSFHDLAKYVPDTFSFYAMPWGVDPDLFYRFNYGPRNFTAMVTGEVAETESLDKVHEAVEHLGLKMMHTGRDFGWSRRSYQNSPVGLTQKLIQYLNDAYYVPSLREIEGFELMALEGLMCGARPIVYDLDTYRWYKKYAIVIDPKKDVTAQLIEIFKEEPIPVSDEERKEIADIFSWGVLIPKFFDKVKELLP